MRTTSALLTEEYHLILCFNKLVQYFHSPVPLQAHNQTSRSKFWQVAKHLHNIY